MRKPELKPGCEIWYIDYQNNVVKGTVFSIRYNEQGDMRFISISVPNDFVGLAAEYVGIKLFMSEEEANAQLNTKSSR